MSSFNSIQPVPPDYHAGSTGKWLFTIWAGGFALVVLPYAFYRLAKYRDSVPLLVWIGGFICSLGEPMLDHIGHLWWPQNLPGPVFKGYDLSVPLLIPPCYAFFVSGMGYVAYRQFLKGVTVRKVFLVWLAISSTDLALEIPGVAANVYKYYGNEPFYVFNFPLHWAWLNGTGFLAVGFLLYLVVPRLQGARKALLLLVTVSAFLGSYGITAWPAFLSLNWKMSSIAQALVDLCSLGLCLLVVRGIAEVVAKRQPVGEAETARAPSPARVREPSGATPVTA
jgi:hypothetical protein